MEIIIAADAIKCSFGAELLHKKGQKKENGYYMSTLLPTERNYSQIQKEALLVFALKDIPQNVTR